MTFSEGCKNVFLSLAPDAVGSALYATTTSFSTTRQYFCEGHHAKPIPSPVPHSSPFPFFYAFSLRVTVTQVRLSLVLKYNTFVLFFGSYSFILNQHYLVAYSMVKKTPLQRSDLKDFQSCSPRPLSSPRGGVIPYRQTP